MSAAAKVLVVDDTPANISLMLDALSDAGYDVLVAESAASAFALLEHNAPDLILLDVLMPGVNGFDACVRLKADARWSEIPVLFMTALDDGSEKVRAFTAGAVDYITKPVHPPEVLARVTHLYPVTFEQLTKEFERLHKCGAQTAFACAVNPYEKLAVKFRHNALSISTLYDHGGTAPVGCGRCTSAAASGGTCPCAAGFECVDGACQPHPSSSVGSCPAQCGSGGCVMNFGGGVICYSGGAEGESCIEYDRENGARPCAPGLFCQTSCSNCGGKCVRVTASMCADILGVPAPTCVGN